MLAVVDCLLKAVTGWQRVCVREISCDTDLNTNSDRRPKAEREGYNTSHLEHPFWAVTAAIHVISCHFFVSDHVRALVGV